MRRAVILSADEHVMILDGLGNFFTEEYWTKHPRKAKKYWDVYQKVGQALGEKNITLSWKEADEK